jgi:hypothetical protein
MLARVSEAASRGLARAVQMTSDCMRKTMERTQAVVHAKGHEQSADKARAQNISGKSRGNAAPCK